MKKLFSIFIFLLSSLYSETNFSHLVKSLTEEITKPKGATSQISLSNISPFLEEENVEFENLGDCNPFNIKTATKEDFYRIEWIDRFLAKNIILYRERYGLYSVDELRNVKGMNEIIFHKIKNFIFQSRECLKKEKPKPKPKTTQKVKRKRPKLPKLKLQIVFNDRVKILNQWYKKGDRVRGYIISQIGTDSVLLHKRGLKKKLTIYQKSKPKKIFIDIE